MTHYVISITNPNISDRDVYEGATPDEAYEAFVTAHATDGTPSHLAAADWYYPEAELRAARSSAMIKPAEYKFGPAEEKEFVTLVQNTTSALAHGGDHRAAAKLQEAASCFLSSDAEPSDYSDLADEICGLTDWIDEASDSDVLTDKENHVRACGGALVTFIFQDLPLPFLIPES